MYFVLGTNEGATQAYGSLDADVHSKGRTWNADNYGDLTNLFATILFLSSLSQAKYI